MCLPRLVSLKCLSSLAVHPGVVLLSVLAILCRHLRHNHDLLPMFQELLCPQGDCACPPLTTTVCCGLVMAARLRPCNVAVFTFCVAAHTFWWRRTSMRARWAKRLFGGSCSPLLLQNHAVEGGVPPPLRNGSARSPCARNKNDKWPPAASRHPGQRFLWNYIFRRAGFVRLDGKRPGSGYGRS